MARAPDGGEHVRPGAVHRLWRPGGCYAAVRPERQLRRQSGWLVSPRRAGRLGRHAGANAAPAGVVIDRTPARAQLSQHFFAEQAPINDRFDRNDYKRFAAEADFVGFDMDPVVKFCGRVPLLDVFRAQRELMTIYAPGKPTFQWIETSKMTASAVDAVACDRQRGNVACDRGRRLRHRLLHEQLDSDLWAPGPSTWGSSGSSQ